MSTVTKGLAFVRITQSSTLPTSSAKDRSRSVAEACPSEDRFIKVDDEPNISCNPIVTAVDGRTARRSEFPDDERTPYYLCTDTDNRSDLPNTRTAAAAVLRGQHRAKELAIGGVPRQTGSRQAPSLSTSGKGGGLRRSAQ